MTRKGLVAAYVACAVMVTVYGALAYLLWSMTSGPG